MKYGALSEASGTLDVSSATHGSRICLKWLERGGPVVAKPDGAAGFGSKLVQRTVTGQLGGSIEHEWSEEGLIVTLFADRQCLTR